MDGRKLTKIREIPELLATCYQIEGTDRMVLELHMFGVAYASYYLLLRSPAVLDEPEIAEQIGLRPSDFGKKLNFGHELSLDPATGDVVYADPDHSPTP
jgi:hypothetical protein